MLHSNVPLARSSMTQPTAPEDSGARPSSFVAPSRETARRVEAFLTEAPQLRTRFSRAREFRRILRRVSNFDLSSRCNLRCDGCFYLRGDYYNEARDQVDLATCRSVSQYQARRGVTFASIAGAEPALEQDR